MTRGLATATAAVAAIGLTACAAGGRYVWVDAWDQGPQPAEGSYVIAPGDLISVRVYNQEALSGKVRVRADGKISLTFVNDVQAGGLTPTVLCDNLQRQLKAYILNPVVTVTLEEPRPFDVFVVGEVAHPGRFSLDPTATVLQAIAAAGGLTQYASRDRIFVVRNDGATSVRIRFKYDALARGEGKAGAFRVRYFDTVVVE